MVSRASVLGLLFCTYTHTVGAFSLMALTIIDMLMTPKMCLQPGHPLDSRLIHPTAYLTSQFECP